MLEAVQGEGGVIPATAEFMKGVRALCSEHGIMMLCDEVQCGLARTGHWFAFQEYGVEPDAFSTAKSLGSGYPIGAICAKPEFSDVFKPGHHASTFGGTPLACTAAVATLQVIAEENLPAKADRAGALLMEALRDYSEKFTHIKEIRGLGLMIGIVLDTDAKPLCNILADMGLLTLPAGEKVVRLLPPLNVKDAEIEEALDIIHDALCKLHGMEQDETAEETTNEA
jgi:acetylornithine/succinyldiaminopimelate/putrescine aminotransferase